MKSLWSGSEATGLSVFTHSKRKEAGAYEGRNHRPTLVAPSVEAAIGFVLGLATAALVINALVVLAGIR